MKSMKFNNPAIYPKLIWKALSLTLVLGILLPVYSYSQEITRCATMENLEEMHQEDPGLKKRMIQIEKEIETFLSKKDIINGIVNIPVVFHVIHDGDDIGSNENIATSFLHAQIDQLNDDFRRTNSDAGNTPLEFKDEAADTRIEFCLAQIDPRGDPTSGIERIDISSLEEVSLNDCWTTAYINSNIKVPTVWDSESYLNIWVVEKIEQESTSSGSSDCFTGILGYAQFPGGNANTDGVVVMFNTVGSIADPFPGGAPFNLGRTATHEVGHWLDLEHIWGNDGTACTGSDLVADTPNQAGFNFGCPSHPQNTCGSNDMFMNYMDYSDDDCFNMFTQGQADRMHAAINVSRRGILSSLCHDDCPSTKVVNEYTTVDPITENIAYQASNTVLSYITIATNANVEYRAGASICLFPGMHVEYGSLFSACIAPCEEQLQGPGSNNKNNIGPSPALRDGTGIGENALNVDIFPNPFSNKITIHADFGAKTKISIHDIFGKPIGNWELNYLNGNFEVDLPSLPNGVYFVTIGANNKQVTKKLIKNQ